MKLIIFDIDGTIVDSVKIDDECFIQTFKELHSLDLSNVDWKDFKNVTDTGLTLEIFDKYFNRKPSEDEFNKIKIRFTTLIKNRTDEFKEVDGFLYFISLLDSTKYKIAFATGGWKETAMIKCESIHFNLNKYIFKSSSDHFKREEIIKLAIEESCKANNVSAFEKLIYFGDGFWDYKTTKALGIDLVGVDIKSNGKLAKLGVKNIIKNYLDFNSIIQYF